MHNSSIKIAVFDDMAQYLTGMQETLKEAGYDVKAILVGPNDTPESIAQEILEYGADIVLADESLVKFSGAHVLKAAGEKFFSRNNPRVVSVSTGAVLLKQLSGGSFAWKRGLSSPEEFKRKTARDEFLSVVAEAVKKVFKD